MISADEFAKRSFLRTCPRPCQSGVSTGLQLAPEAELRSRRSACPQTDKPVVASLGETRLRAPVCAFAEQIASAFEQHTKKQLATNQCNELSSF